MKALSGNNPVKNLFLSSLLTFFFITISTASPAAIPLITDDTGTQGKGKFQIEILGEYTKDKEREIETEPWLESQQNGVTSSITYGIADPIDIVLTVPYHFLQSDDGEAVEKASGLSDSAIELKWRFFEKHGFSFAVKPGLTLPSGNENKGLGAGNSTYYLYLIGSKELGPWVFHSNIAYIRNENKNDERNDIWQASLAVTREITKNLKLVADIGVTTNPDRSSIVPPAYILGGFICSPIESIDIGLGIKGGLNSPETDLSIRGGITWRF
jgi:hypothetical protein